MLKLQLLDFLKSNQENLDTAFALFSLQTGLKVSTLKQYYDELKEAGLISEEEQKENKEPGKEVKGKCHRTG